MNVSETYKLPPEPAVGTVLKDVETGEYTRRTETGWTVFLSARPADTVVGFGGWPNMLARADHSEEFGGGIGIRTLLDRIGANCYDERFIRVQDRQDRGHSWQSAVTALDE